MDPKNYVFPYVYTPYLVLNTVLMFPRNTRNSACISGEIYRVKVGSGYAEVGVECAISNLGWYRGLLLQVRYLSLIHI